MQVWNPVGIILLPVSVYSIMVIFFELLEGKDQILLSWQYQSQLRAWSKAGAQWMNEGMHEWVNEYYWAQTGLSVTSIVSSLGLFRMI